MRFLSLFFVLLAMALPAHAFDPATTGVVAIHGKWGDPSGMRPLREELEAAGFLVETPEMPWSGRRLYDRPYPDLATEIDAAAERLKARGAARIVVAGHSLGGSGALFYGSLGRPAAALVLIAPAHAPDGKYFSERTTDDVAKARAMVAAGKGEETAWFTSYNSDNRNRQLSIKAAVYLSYYAPDAPAAMAAMAPKLGAVPVLWVAASTDTANQYFGGRVWPSLPEATPKLRLDVSSDHMGAVMAGRTKIVEWLKGLVE